jgi:hypothetical protein
VAPPVAQKAAEPASTPPRSDTKADAKKSPPAVTQPAAPKFLPPPELAGDLKPEPSAARPRLPDGTPPSQVTDTGITALQVEGTVNPKDSEPVFAGYTCCNLHYSGDWVSDLNYGSDTLIPAGSPIRIADYGRWHLITELDGKKIRIGLDYGRKKETLAQFARKLTIDKDLRFRMASFPSSVQDAIRAGKVMPGMSKEQVVMAVGFPARHETPTVDAPSWRFWYTSRIQYTVQFDESGRVKGVDVDPDTRPKVVYGAAPKQ